MNFTFFNQSKLYPSFISKINNDSSGNFRELINDTLLSLDKKHDRKTFSKIDSLKMDIFCNLTDNKAKYRKPTGVKCCKKASKINKRNNNILHPNVFCDVRNVKDGVFSGFEGNIINNDSEYFFNKINGAKLRGKSANLDKKGKFSGNKSIDMVEQWNYNLRKFRTIKRNKGGFNMDTLTKCNEELLHTLSRNASAEKINKKINKFVNDIKEETPKKYYVRNDLIYKIKTSQNQPNFLSCKTAVSSTNTSVNVDNSNLSPKSISINNLSKYKYQTKGKYYKNQILKTCQQLELEDFLRDSPKRSKNVNKILHDIQSRKNNVKRNSKLVTSLNGDKDMVNYLQNSMNDFKTKTSGHDKYKSSFTNNENSNILNSINAKTNKKEKMLNFFRGIS